MFDPLGPSLALTTHVRCCRCHALHTLTILVSLAEMRRESWAEPWFLCETCEAAEPDPIDEYRLS